jgi:hypothetical protein
MMRWTRLVNETNGCAGASEKGVCGIYQEGNELDCGSILCVRVCVCVNIARRAGCSEWLVDFSRDCYL